MKVRVHVGDFEREDDIVATTDTEKAEVLNLVFTSVIYHRRQGKHAEHGGKT